MTVKISQTAEIQKFFEEAAGYGNDNGSPRLKQIVLRVLQDTAKIIEDLEVTDDEFWTAVDYLNRALAAPARPGREDADAGRRQDIRTLLDTIASKHAYASGK